MTSFLEQNVTMKVNRKYSRVGTAVRRSKEYLSEVLRLTHQGYDVYDKIVLGVTPGRGTLRLIAISKNIPTEAKSLTVFILFEYTYSFWRASIKFEDPAERDSREIGLIFSRHRDKTTVASKEGVTELSETANIPLSPGKTSFEL